MKRSLLSLAGIAVGAFAAWLLVTSAAPASWIAAGAPCPRNWAWLPAWLPRASPLEAVDFTLDGRAGRLCYGRPSLHWRKMIGGAAVPYGALWRTGANEPTTLHLTTAARLGPVALLRGSYSLYTVPNRARWRVIVNASTRQWGLESEYTEQVRAREVGHFDVPAESLDQPVETLTFTALPAAAGAVELRFEWERTRLRLHLAPGLGDLDDPELDDARLTPEDL